MYAEDSWEAEHMVEKGYGLKNKKLIDQGMGEVLEVEFIREREWVDPRQQCLFGEEQFG